MSIQQRIAIAGSAGRMGRTLLATVLSADDCILTAALVRPASEWVGREVSQLLGGNVSLLLTDQLSALQQADCLIDFTRPDATLQHLRWCRQHQVNMVIGTTGFTETEKAELHAASQDIAIVFAPNMSVGVNVTLKLLQMAAKALSHGYDIEIVEMHHRHKVDAPSGTALRMGEVIANTLGRDLSTCALYGREGVTGERDPSTIGFAALRGGDVVGEHTVIFAGMGERIEISHKASSRDTFAQGALLAARFLADKRSGFYDMAAVLNM
jgi:4-hydroxy-tetrahydrodipicolinate reductase